ncbi:putative membrane protein YphA (DoxX/SURF4 family) [Streptosporangium album]|uniref:Putative membrane protein YphA (DoxX/SURF4 family) n=1 Tax=Streptosporangium album TaxID=47479 RepID=A0A7W7WE16_9ACTN|nr:DoxX family protein [Streptosporangium album]MBB4943696.1 putative membrane protein YphA (DoxX/SURF4 family) [Streptosporangium album]
MNVALWIAQGLLAAAFLFGGLTKATQPREKLAGNMPWVQDFSDGQVKAIGTVEVLAAIGLIAPAVTGILPVLTPLAAVGLVITMIAAAVVHARRGEYPGIAVNVVLLALAAFVAWGRFGPYAF